ncbi:hypothetical protein THAOC_28517, partial [Thalassiosira oceanica]
MEPNLSLVGAPPSAAIAKASEREVTHRARLKAKAIGKSADGRRRAKASPVSRDSSPPTVDRIRMASLVGPLQVSEKRIGQEERGWRSRGRPNVDHSTREGVKRAHDLTTGIGRAGPAPGLSSREPWRHGVQVYERPFPLPGDGAVPPPAGGAAAAALGRGTVPPDVDQAVATLSCEGERFPTLLR